MDAETDLAFEDDTPEGECHACGNPLPIGPPVLDLSQVYYVGYSAEWCSTACHERSAERYWSNR